MIKNNADFPSTPARFPAFLPVVQVGRDWSLLQQCGLTFTSLLPLCAVLTQVFWHFKLSLAPRISLLLIHMAILLTLTGLLLALPPAPRWCTLPRLPPMLKPEWLSKGKWVYAMASLCRMPLRASHCPWRQQFIVANKNTIGIDLFALLSCQCVMHYPPSYTAWTHAREWWIWDHDSFKCLF